ncbi:hypothetical protein [Brucella anthropi]|uniref:hypothetical protein n=1 Tax=Brucella anthropi TaxID=529 RepID=UPI000CFABD60|nr:hypothetical protein [Ochrobactrum sp. MYb49]PQZ62727.1 hypothetical protein CQ057_14875 [Ochrobactrum sp. MYb49]
MSYNPKTKTYWELVKRLARDFEYRSTKIESVEDFWTHFRKKHPGAPRHLLDSALKLAAEEQERSIEFSERDLLEDRQKLVLILEAQKSVDKPKLRLVKGAA